MDKNYKQMKGDMLSDVAERDKKVVLDLIAVILSSFVDPSQVLVQVYSSGWAKWYTIRCLYCGQLRRGEREQDFEESVRKRIPKDLHDRVTSVEQRMNDDGAMALFVRVLQTRVPDASYGWSQEDALREIGGIKVEPDVK